MMNNLLFDKTDKGREEISTRKYQLPARLRGVLLLVDGKHSGDALLKKFGGVGLNEQTLAELAASGFIQGIEVAPSPAAERVPAETAPEPAAEPLQADSAGIPPDGETQYQSVYHFYSETIKSTIGLRGFALQLKVERCASLEDFRALRHPYLEAVFNAKGAEMARSLRDRLDQLLYLGESAPPHQDIPGSPF
jgi:hypothetical protein